MISRPSRSWATSVLQNRGRKWVNTSKLPTATNKAKLLQRLTLGQNMSSTLDVSTVLEVLVLSQNTKRKKSSVHLLKASFQTCQLDQLSHPKNLNPNKKRSSSWTWSFKIEWMRQTQRENKRKIDAIFSQQYRLVISKIVEYQRTCYWAIVSLGQGEKWVYVRVPNLNQDHYPKRDQCDSDQGHHTWVRTKKP